MAFLNSFNAFLKFAWLTCCFFKISSNFTSFSCMTVSYNRMYLLVSSFKKQGFWKLITTLVQCARSSTPLSVGRAARHYHGTSSNLPATKRKQLKSSFFCQPTMLHWTCQCKQNVKYYKKPGDHMTYQATIHRGPSLMAHWKSPHMLKRALVNFPRGP